MTQKSLSRRNRDAAARQAAGGKLPNASAQRQKTARCWLELKTIHERTTSYILKLTQRLAQYNNALVILKMAKNGDKNAWDELHKDLQAKAGMMSDKLQNLWDQHKDKNELTYSITEMGESVRVMEAYQAFDMEFFQLFPPIITDLNALYNKALKDLLDAKDALAAKMAEDTAAKLLDPTVVSDYPPAEVTDEQVLGQLAVELEVPAETTVDEVVPDTSDEPVDVDPKLGFGLIRPNF